MPRTQVLVPGRLANRADGTGRVGRPISRLLERHGYRLAAAPDSFLADPRNTLLDGEAGQARRWEALRLAGIEAPPRDLLPE